MSGNASTGAGGSKPSPGTEAVAVLNDFRAALVAGQRPRIKDVLLEWAESGHSALLRGLVTLEVAHRLRHGEKPTVAEYRARFPGQEQAIDEAFRHTGTMPRPGGPDVAAAEVTGPRAAGDPRAADQPPPLDLAAAPYALAADSPAVRQFGDYELQEKISHDELGVLYRARQVSMDRVVALKTIMADGLVSDANVRQFYRDSRAVVALDHPGIVPVFDVGEHEGQHFVSMGFIEGETLAKKKKDGVLGLREGVEVIRQVAETMAYAHSKGVVHRNLTPKNILLNASGRPNVIGFCWSAPLQSQGSVSLQGWVIGAAGYLAPEQAREGQNVGPAADIHALGAVLYFVLTGRPPFHGRDLVETLMKVLHRDPKPPRRLNTRVPSELEAICLKSLQKRPAQRYSTAADLAEELRRWLRNEKPTAPQESPVSRSARRVGQVCRTHPRASIGAASVLGAVLVTLAFLLPLAPKKEQPPVEIGTVGGGGAAGVPGAAPQGAEPTPSAEASIVSRGKRSTALVMVGAGGRSHFGSAFCIDASGLFITGAHVVAPASTPDSGTIKLVLDDGQSQKVVPARIIRSDADFDLAVLRLEQPGDVTVVGLELGRSAGLTETAEVTAFGYPLGDRPPHPEGRYPDVTVNVGHISALPKVEGRSSLIQLDAALNLGNSGGPVLDREGKVIGVVAAGIAGARGLNYAIPVDRLTRFLRSPEVVFDPPPIRDVDLDKPVVWTIEVRPPPIGPLPPDVNLAVRLGRDPNGREAAVKRLDDGRFQAEVVLSRPPDEPIELNVMVDGKSVLGKTIDRNLMIGGQTYALSRLSLIQRLRPATRYRVHTSDGKELRGPVEGLGTAEVPPTTSDKPLDLSTASLIEVRNQGQPAIEATVEVKAGPDTLAVARKQLALVAVARRAPNPAEPRPIRAPARSVLAAAPAAQPAPRVEAGAGQPPAEIRLPGEIDSLAVGGDRYLVLAFRNPEKLLVFDAAAAAIVKEVPLNSPAMIAAGSQSFVVAYLDQGVVQTWDFATMAVKKQQNLMLATRARIGGISMGSQSEGPVLLFWSTDSPAHNVAINEKNAFGPSDPRLRAGLLDPNSLTFQKIGKFELHSPWANRGLPPHLASKDGRWFVAAPSFMPFATGANLALQVRASPQGDLFAVASSFGTALITLKRSTSISRSVACFLHQNSGRQDGLIPAADGRTVFTGNNRTIRIESDGAVDREGDLPGRVPAQGRWSQLFPTDDSAYFLLYELDQQTSEGQVSVLLPTGEVLLKQSLLAAWDRGRNQMWQMMNSEKPGLYGRRVLLFPQHELLVVIPTGEDHLQPRKIALRDALNHLEHPVVVSPSDVVAARGRIFSHQIRVLSKAGGVTCSAPKGFAPENMKVLPDGQVTWPVPPKFAGQEVSAVIRVKDATGREVSHRLNILVR
jgi:S1-C subfamily serine protease